MPRHDIESNIPQASEASQLGYSPATPADYTTEPHTPQAALDELAANVAAGGGTPSGTVADETAWDIVPAAGTAATYSRGDHTHGTPTEPVGGGATEIDDLTDVDTATDPPALNEVLKWNGTNWVPAAYAYSFTFSIDSFVCSEADATQLIGLGTWKATGTLSFTATYNNAPGGMTATVTMTGTATGWTTLAMTPVTGPEVTVADTSYPTTPGNTITFTLTQSADGTTAVDTVTFNNTLRYGNSAAAGEAQTEATLEALTEVPGPDETRSQTISNIATTAGYLVFAWPSRLTDVTQVQRDSGFGYVTCSFNATRTTVAPTIQGPVANVTNSAAYSESFDCCTSTDTGLANNTNDFKVLQSATVINYVYWGELNKAAGYTEADVEGNYATQPGKLGTNTISSMSMTVNAGVAEYTYIAYPARLAALTHIVIGGLESLTDFNVDSTTLDVTNPEGYTEPYRVYVSDNPGFTNPTTMTVSNT